MTEHEINLKRYEILRDYIKHENLLINHRLTWLLVSQGLIFSAFSVLFIPISNTIELDDKVPTYITMIRYLQIILSCLGASISVISFVGIKAAIGAITRINQDHKGWPKKVALPGLIGGGNTDFDYGGIFTALSIPIVLFLAWLCVLLCRVSLIY